MVENDRLKRNGLTKWISLKKRLTIGFINQLVKPVVKQVVKLCNSESSLH